MTVFASDILEIYVDTRNLYFYFSAVFLLVVLQFSSLMVLNVDVKVKNEGL